MWFFKRDKAKSNREEASQDQVPGDKPAGSDEGSQLPTPSSGFTTRKLEMRMEPISYLEVGLATDRGRVREHNEDSEWVWPVMEGPVRGGLFVVADGMGGHAAGEVASRTAVQALERVAKNNWPPATEPEQARGEFGRWIQLANKDVFDAASSQYNGMGTTITAALVLERNAYVANAGDSRTYLWRAGALQRITRDHSLVMSLVEARTIAPEDIYTHPRRNEIYRALGLDPNVDIDIFGPLELLPDDRLVLCCDGLWEMVRDPEIAATLARSSSAQAACDELVRLANAHGGEDNISVIVVNVL